MKKLLSLVLALIMATSVSVIGFAHENVDNTFDNFIPAPGVQAPDNWYDPFAYDEEGLMKFGVVPLDGGAAYYCQTYHKMFVPHPSRYNTAVTNPYRNYFTLDISPITGTESAVVYCPYCGLNRGSEIDCFNATHEEIPGIVYGFHCTDCGKFSAYYNIMATNVEYQCNHCGKFITPEFYYRFTCAEHRNADYYYLFEETAYQFGDGEDGFKEDLHKCNYGGFSGWKNDPQKQPNAFVRFFRNIKNAFSSFFKRIANLFK